MVNFTLPSTTNEMVSISTSQTVRSWVVIIHLRRSMELLSLNVYDTPGLAPCMNVLFGGQMTFQLTSEQGYLVERLKSSFRKFYGRYGGLIQQYEVFLSIKWYSDPWRTVTSQPITLSTNIMNLIPDLTFTELWVVSMAHLKRVRHGSRERFPAPGSVPL